LVPGISIIKAMAAAINTIRKKITFLLTPILPFFFFCPEVGILVGKWRQNPRMNLDFSKS
jgi:hypothetical protein